MRNFIFIWFALCSFCFAQERPVAKPFFDKDEQMVKNLLSKLEDSMSNNNLRDYMACFTKEYARKNKRESSVLFVEHELSLEFNNFQILESDDNEIEIITKYTTSYSGENVITIANVLLKKESDDVLLVANQEVISQKGNDKLIEKDENQQDCKNGMCRVRPAANKIEEKDRKTFSLFNDANGNPDPDGPMWLDPRTLMEVYPEQYECIGCR